MSRRPLIVVLALGLAISSVASAGASPHHAPRAASRPPKPSYLHPAAVAAPITISVGLRPRNARLLGLLAQRARSGVPSISIARLRALFSPRPADRNVVTSYLVKNGFRLQSNGILSQTFTGTIGAAEHAFTTQIGVYRQTTVIYRSPVRAITLPSAVSRRVAVISGLDTRQAQHPATTQATPAAVVSPCLLASFPGGYQPGDFAGINGYDFQSLIDAGYNGSGENVAFVEFSNYLASEVSTFESCYGLSTPVTMLTVQGGTSDTSNRTEDELDVDTTLAAAPGLSHAYMYVAPKVASQAAVIDQILTDKPSTGVTVISDSWGNCDIYGTLAQVTLENEELQLAALAGVTVYASSGDHGSSDCYEPGVNTNGSISADDPASQPYATGVGGTTLSTATSGAAHETVWNDGTGWSGGGGVSYWWPMPSWQSGPGVIEPGYSSAAPCGLSSGDCRESPDVSLDADGSPGYIIFSGGGWYAVGGTSAATPLLAGITADANQYSLANGGARLGFANPFFYQRYNAGSTMFHDVTLGSNDIVGGGLYPAGAGYDMASGLGSIDGATFASDLAVTTSSVTIDQPQLLAGASHSTIPAGGRVTISGTLHDATTGLPRTNDIVYLRLSGEALHPFTETGSNGSFHFSFKPSRLTTWTVLYPGGDGLAATATPTHTVHVAPRLTNAASLKKSSGHYVVAAGTQFTISGNSAPNLHGRKLTLQYRQYGTSAWHNFHNAKVASGGGYHVRGIYMPQPARFYWRWRYLGTLTGAWVTAYSPIRLIVSR